MDWPYSPQHYFKCRVVDDNIILGQETTRSIDKKNRAGNVVFALIRRKLLISKSGFFIIYFIQLWLPHFIRLVNGLHTECFSIRVNGSLKGYFCSYQGIRQGDPIWPSVFIIAQRC